MSTVLAFALMLPLGMCVHLIDPAVKTPPAASYSLAQGEPSNGR